VFPPAQLDALFFLIVNVARRLVRGKAAVRFELFLIEMRYLDQEELSFRV
jgi:hypothetical protein